MKKLIITLTIAAITLVGCGSNDDNSPSTETRKVTQSPVTVTDTPTTTQTVAPPTKTETEVTQPTDTVTAPSATVTETHKP